MKSTCLKVKNGKISFSNTPMPVKWALLDGDKRSLWFQSYPLFFYDAVNRSFNIESLAKRSSNSDLSFIYNFTIPLSNASNTASWFNLDWQKLAGKSISEIQEGSPLHFWYQYYWMTNATPFP